MVCSILVFTTDEIYSLISKEQKIFMNIYLLKSQKLGKYKINEKWEQLFKIKQEANIAIGSKRSSKEIGSSLEADVKLIVNNKVNY